MRVATSPLHRDLDDLVGEFATRDDYADYLRKTHRFRRAVEQALCNGWYDLWTPVRIATLVAQDLADLGIPALPAAEAPRWTQSAAAYLGAVYVLEGSSLGARLLLRRAETLGLKPDFGARHLCHQAADAQRWREFLTVLETVPDDMHGAAIAAARDVFRLALSLYSKTAHECA